MTCKNQLRFYAFQISRSMNRKLMLFNLYIYLEKYKLQLDKILFNRKRVDFIYYKKKKCKFIIFLTYFKF